MKYSVSTTSCIKEFRNNSLRLSSVHINIYISRIKFRNTISNTVSSQLLDGRHGTTSERLARSPSTPFSDDTIPRTRHLRKTIHLEHTKSETGIIPNEYGDEPRIAGPSGVEAECRRGGPPLGHLLDG